MPKTPFNGERPPIQVIPVIRYDAEKAAHWFDEYARLTRIAAVSPSAWENRWFVNRRFKAYLRFLFAFLPEEA